MMNADDLEHRLNYMAMQIDGIRTEMQQHRDEILNLLKSINRTNENLNSYIDNNDEIRDVIGEKLFMMFYKVFPEAAEADKALERIVKAQKKKPME